MTSPSFHDLEQLSAFLDGKLSREAETRLTTRLESDAELRTSLEELRQTRALLRRTPKRRAPRNFTLTPKMAGVRPPMPRSVPAFGWASAVAVVLFALTFLTNLVAPVTLAPMMAAAPKAVAPVLGSSASNANTAGAAPSAQDLTTTPPPALLLQAVPPATSEAESSTPELQARTNLQATPPVEAIAPMPAARPPAFHLSGLQIGLVALAVLFGLLAFLIRLTTRRVFFQNIDQEHKKQ
ncbi:MAG: hypothetical protein ABSB41_15780 [Anaerolineales bacterium]|jgi:negative regulator of sigma E activity